jgi:hypothetical protein
VNVETIAEWFDGSEEQLALKPLGASPAKPPEPIYHYTTAASLLSKLRSKKLWATDARFLNDAGELKRGFEKHGVCFVRPSGDQRSITIATFIA